MRAILYRNFMLLRPYLIVLMIALIIIPLLMIIPMDNIIKVAIVSVLSVFINVIFMATTYYIFLRIDKNNASNSFLSLPVKQTTVVNAHYLSGLILIVLSQVTLIVYSLSAILFKQDVIDSTFDFSGLYVNMAGNLLTVSLIFPFGEFKRFIKIPLIIWIFIVAVILPNIIKYLDFLLNYVSISSNIFTKFDVPIYLIMSVFLFIVTYMIAIIKAHKNKITI
ncbi:phenol-soluble modulin export ABC transporter permease subunit PmtB [Mammaliicoccus stepanovicii]|uniref:Membrane protein n=1 Tax=Mammaliicoccus stepanovicii TaxID=643214 RepID=A0A239YSK0_9STAP|nr:ABC-2 transporter permease [Mammaliicoccus stepanovicii]PNZ73234.1 hypothetical protein CD111_10075 [Mammaliicoccus stepanovicii]GGI42425.1 hypothetical protein GCM10010896_18360 [Mammaliicoccus stepanovicii]SNV61188.1 membrane protein [Mammaliicoccus stepanovicii]